MISRDDVDVEWYIFNRYVQEVVTTLNYWYDEDSVVVHISQIHFQ